ncbi:MAG: hypothetical protein RL120_15950 [Gammaproteobacteria bacterium]
MGGRFLAGLRMAAAVVLYLLALTTLVNLVLITMRPETISVVNAMIGQGVIMIAMTAIATIQFRKGLRQWRELSKGDGS